MTCFRRCVLLLLAAFWLVTLSSVFAQTTPSGGTSSANSAPAPHATDQSLAKASKEAEGDETAQFRESPSVQWLARKLGITVEQAYLLSVLFNFAIIAGFIGYGVKKFLPGALKARTESINKSIAEAQRASADANQRLRDIEAKLSSLGSQIAALEASATAQAQEEEGRLRASAEEEKKKIVRSAEQDIAAAAANARRELRSYAAELAVDLAEKKINVDSATDQDLVRNFADQLGRDGHN